MCDRVTGRQAARRVEDEEPVQAGLELDRHVVVTQPGVEHGRRACGRLPVDDRGPVVSSIDEDRVAARAGPVGDAVVEVAAWVGSLV